MRKIAILLICFLWGVSATAQRNFAVGASVIFSPLNNVNKSRAMLTYDYIGIKNFSAGIAAEGMHDRQEDLVTTNVVGNTTSVNVRRDISAGIRIGYRLQLKRLSIVPYVYAGYGRIRGFYETVFYQNATLGAGYYTKVLSGKDFYGRRYEITMRPTVQFKLSEHVSLQASYGIFGYIANEWRHARYTGEPPSAQTDADGNLVIDPNNPKPPASTYGYQSLYGLEDTRIGVVYVF